MCMFATSKSNENDRFSAQSELVRLISGREIDVVGNVVFLGNTKIFEEKAT